MSSSYSTVFWFSLYTVHNANLRSKYLFVRVLNIACPLPILNVYIYALTICSCLEKKRFTISPFYFVSYFWQNPKFLQNPADVQKRVKNLANYLKFYFFEKQFTISNIHPSLLFVFFCRFYLCLNQQHYVFSIVTSIQ